MRASLVSATSIATALALEAGPAMAGPVFDLSAPSPSTCNNTASPSTCTVTFYALPGKAATSQKLTLTADTKITGTATFPSAPIGFTGSTTSSNGNLSQGATFTSKAYDFTGAASAGPTGQSTTVTGTAIASVTAGNGKNANASQTSTLTFMGVTVSPIESVSSALQVYARAGSGSAGSATATVTVSNVGKGNLATGGPTKASNLDGKIGPISGAKWNGPGVTSFSIQDNTTPGTTSNTFTYTYTPTAARGTSSTGLVPIAFTNGSSDGKNNSQTVSVSLTGSTVGPVYQSSLNGTVNTPGKNGGSPTSTIDWSTVAKNTTHTEVLTLANISTDLNGGNNKLTNLSIESFSITGKNATAFSINGKQSGTSVAAVLPENGGSETIDIDFSAASTGTYNALLQLNTDVGAAFGGSGNFYEYLLTALVTAQAPEPGTALLLSAGLGGLLLLRRRQPRNRVTAPSSPIVEEELGSC